MKVKDMKARWECKERNKCGAKVVRRMEEASTDGVTYRRVDEDESLDFFLMGGAILDHSRRKITLKQRNFLRCHHIFVQDYVGW